MMLETELPVCLGKAKAVEAPKTTVETKAVAVPKPTEQATAAEEPQPTVEAKAVEAPKSAGEVKTVEAPLPTDLELFLKYRHCIGMGPRMFRDTESTGLRTPAAPPSTFSMYRLRRPAFSHRTTDR